MKEYSDYLWKNGVPYGINGELKETTYQIISDPYHKWISIEKYFKGDYESTIYDSHLFDFRWLNPEQQTAWQKITINDSALIRNQDHRALVRETYLFEKDKCRECRTYSIHGVLISIQKMRYTFLGDPINQVILYDANEHVVMSKEYNADEAGDFTTESSNPKVHAKL